MAAASCTDEGDLRHFVNRTPEDLAQQLKANLAEEEKYAPDYSDVYQPSFPDLIKELSQTGIYDRDLPNKDRNIAKLEALALSMFPTWDQIFRIAGPTRMSIRASRVVNERPYSIRDPRKFEAMRLIIDDLLKKDVIARQRDSPFRSPCLLVPKKHQEGAPLQAQFRFVTDFRALNKVTISDSYQPPATSTVINALSGCNWISFLDNEKAFWQLAVNEAGHFRN